jgi:SAM-dependent methyltransferase
VTSTRRTYFDQMYGRESDPWGFETSDYEQRKYALTVASLPKGRYRSCYEPGCSIGVLTELLARRCDRVVAIDFVASALVEARRRLAAAPHVTIEERSVSRQWREGSFDLVVLSEIAYYFDEVDLELILNHILAATIPGAHIVGVHWRGETDYPLSGDRVHELIDASTSLGRVVHHLEADFVLDVWERAG